MTILESGELAAKKIGTTCAHQAQRARRVPREVDRSRARCRRYRRAREARLPGVRRAGGVEPGQAEARLPVLRHRVAVHDRSQRPAQIDELDLVEGAARAAGRGARLADREAHRAVPELQGGHRCSIPTRVGQNCEFCGSPALVDYKEIKAPIRPQSLLPFKVTRVAGARADPPLVREQVARAGQAEERARSSTRVHGVYIPYWTFDAQVVCPWEAEAGHYYYTTETYRDNQGRTQTRQVQHVRWEPASGVVEHFFDDEPVPGTQGVVARAAAAGRAVSDAGARALRHGVSLGLRRRALPGRAARRGAGDREEAMTAEARALCAAQIPGDTYRNLEIHPTFSGPDVQAHPRARLAADVHLRPRSVPGGRQRLHRADGRPVSEEPMEDRFLCSWRSSRYYLRRC